jgi:hypothetical protein
VKKKKKKNQNWLMSNPETWWICCYSWVCRSLLNGACRSEWDSYLPQIITTGLRAHANQSWGGSDFGNASGWGHFKMLKLMLFSSSKTKSCDTWWVSGKYPLGIMGKKTRGEFRKANMYHGFSHFIVFLQIHYKPCSKWFLHTKLGNLQEPSSGR